MARVNPELNPVVTMPAGCEPPKIYCELEARYFLQYDGEPAENSASFAFERLKCFSRMVPALPVTTPLSSITTT